MSASRLSRPDAPRRPGAGRGLSAPPTMPALLDLRAPDASPPARHPARPQPRQAQLGQFMTPETIAAFMAGLFDAPMPKRVRLLDAGAGEGSLTAAFVARWAGRPIEADAYECDPAIAARLQTTLHRLADQAGSAPRLLTEDFVQAAARMVRLGQGPRYTHAILNPPYRKIGSDSQHRALLRAAGLETVNLYTGFVGLALELLAAGGRLVAIIPRSFCNGPYYQPFRSFMLRRAAIRHLHLFTARDAVFRRSGVLQENVIISLERGAEQGPIAVSTSTDDSFADYESRRYPAGTILPPHNPGCFIHIPTETLAESFDGSGAFQFRLAELGIDVSTGPVVDFRLRDMLCSMPEPGAVPLLYPSHFSDGGIRWPIAGMKKPNAILHTPDTDKYLYPSGFYAVVRRFSSKEEKRRIVASVVDPVDVPGAALGFENHLNVFHRRRTPLSEPIARGLATYLSTTAIDRYFRQFNGHTQVNATDLRTLRFPGIDALTQLGEWAKTHRGASQDAVDRRVQTMA